MCIRDSRYTPREAIHAEYTPPEQTETSSGGDMPLDEMIPAAEPSPVLVLIMKILEYKMCIRDRLVFKKLGLRHIV